MDWNSIAWWATLVVLVPVSIMDLCTRRIANWVVLPFLLSGIAAQSVVGGLSGTGRSLAGVGLVLLLYGPPCFLRAMGMGDLKLAAGVGAWIGPSQFLMAAIVTAMVGGVMAACYALRYGLLDRSLDDAGELLVQLAKGRISPHRDIRDKSATRHAIPYAPAIAFGTLFSFFMR